VPSETERNVKKASELMASLERLVVKPNGWLFGEKPTALDAHLVVFIARMTDVGRESLIPDKLRQYAQWAMRGSEWTKMRDGRQSTMVPPVSSF
jgi:glutathione S-transferase